MHGAAVWWCYIFWMRDDLLVLTHRWDHPGLDVIYVQRALWSDASSRYVFWPWRAKAFIVSCHALLPQAQNHYGILFIFHDWQKTVIFMCCGCITQTMVPQQQFSFLGVLIWGWRDTFFGFVCLWWADLDIGVLHMSWLRSLHQRYPCPVYNKTMENR